MYFLSKMGIFQPDVLVYPQGSIHSQSRKFRNCDHFGSAKDGAGKAHGALALSQWLEDIVMTRMCVFERLIALDY